MLGRPKSDGQCSSRCSPVARQNAERNNLQSPLMRRLQMDKRCTALVVGLDEPGGAQTPPVTGFQTGKIELGAWRAQVIAHVFRIRKKLGGHNRTYRVAAAIFRAGIASSVPKKPG